MFGVMAWEGTFFSAFWPWDGGSNVRRTLFSSPLSGFQPRLGPGYHTEMIIMATSEQQDCEGRPPMMNRALSFIAILPYNP